VLHQHLGTVPPSSADLLLVAAAAGRPTLDLLRAAAGEPEPRALQPAIDAGLISVAGNEVRFSHPLYRSALYAHASRERRHAVHRRLAELTTDLEERARHLALSADASDEGIAAVLDEAARLARDRGAPDASAELLEHAIRLTPAGEGASVRRRHLLASDDRFAAGDTVAADGHAREALRLSESGTDRAESLRRIAAIDLERGALVDARRSLETAAIEASDDTLVSAEVRRDLAGVLLRAGDLELAESHASSAIERAERSGDTPLVVAARTSLARVTLLRGGAADVLASGLDAVASPGDDGPDLVMAEAEIITGEHERARDRLQRVRASTLERGDERGRRAALARLAEVELRDGSWDRAGSLAEEARSLARDLGLGDATELGLLALVAALRGRADEARAHARLGLREAGDDRRALLWCLGALGFLELSVGRPELAIRHLGRAGGITTDMGITEPAATPFLADEAEALIGAGETAAAEARLAWLEERGEILGRHSAIAAGARGRGLLHAEVGDLAEALASLERSVGLFETVPLPFERARSLLALGTCRRRDRQKRPAREALERALALFEELGAPIWAERSRQELARVSGRRASLTELTESEARVVRLAASGRTNREIARTLSMSVRTVEGHLSHAYAKLGLRSRTELALFFDRPD
jgi:DNA-binding CsgD family transcriptional regulator